MYIFRLFVLLAIPLVLTPSGWTEDRCPELFSGGNVLQPGEIIAAEDFPLDMLEVHYAVLTAPDQTTHLIPATVADGGSRFQMTFAPDAPWTGGRATIAITDGLSICPAVEVTIAPLERADGAFDLMMTGLKERVSQRAVPFGLDFDTLADPSFVADTPIVEALQRLALHVDGMNNSESMFALFKAARTDADKTVQDAAAILEAMLANSGLLEQMVSDLRKDVFYQTSPAKLPPLSPQPMQLTLTPAQPKTLKLKTQPFRSAQDLSDAMIEQLDSESANKPHVQIYRDGAGALLAGGSALGNAAGPAGMKVAKVYDVASQGLFLWGMLDKLQEGLYPNELRDMQIDAAPTTLFLRDDPSEGLIAKVYVTPAAKGIDFGKLALDVALQYAPVGNLVNLRQNSAKALMKGEASFDVRRAFERLNLARANRPPDLKGTLPQQLNSLEQQRLMKIELDAARVNTLHQSEKLQSRITRSQFVDGMLAIPTDMTKPLYFSQIINGLPDLEKMPPFEYPPVNILETGYVQLNASRAGVIELEQNWTRTVSYRAKGVGGVTVYGFTAPGKFGNTQAKGEVDIAVKDGYGLSITPQTVTMVPGDATDFFIAWEGPDHKVRDDFRVTFDTDQKIHRFELAKAPIELPDGRLAYKLSVQTVPLLERFPINITASLLSAPEKKATARINAVRIQPDLGCTEPGARTSYRVIGPDGQALSGLRWKIASGPGRINEDGVYTAPERASRNAHVTIEAHFPGNKPDPLSVSTKLNCGCFWSVSAFGREWTGSNVTITSFSAPGSPPDHMVSFNDTDTLSVIIAAKGGISPGRTGAMMTVSSGENGLAATDCTNNEAECDGKDPPVPNASYAIGQAGPRYVEGSFSGLAVDIWASAKSRRQITEPVLVRFRAGRNDISGNDALAAARLALGNDPEALAQLALLSSLIGTNVCVSEETE